MIAHNETKGSVVRPGNVNPIVYFCCDYHIRAMFLHFAFVLQVSQSSCRAGTKRVTFRHRVSP